MPGISLDAVASVEKELDRVEVVEELCVAMPLVTESAESSELSKAELAEDTTEKEVSIEALLDAMSTEPKDA
jgi:hypothetical protein